MAMSGVGDDDLMQALDAIEREAAVPRARGLEVDVAQLCPAYRNLRPALETVASGVGAIPVWGGRAATGMRFAMQVADAACPETESEPTPPDTA